MTHQLAPELPQRADANALAAHVWPAGTTRDPQGELVIGGERVSDLVERFGTPLMVVDELVAKQRAAEIRAAFSAEFDELDVYYAGKALLTIEVARWMRDAGLKIDVCSGGELAIALAAGIDPGLIGFHGNNKSVRDIAEAVEVGVGTIVADSPIEIERIASVAAAAGARQRVRLRINVGVHASTHEFLATAHEDQKFGVTLADAAALVARIRELDSLEFVGLHSHIGSQIFEDGGFDEAAKRLLELHAELRKSGEVAELNLGGGFGIAYVGTDTPRPITEIAAGIARSVRETCRELRIPVPKIAIEPGRWIIGPAGVTIYTIGTVKAVQLQAGRRSYVSVDGGMSDNPRTALYGAQYAARLANRSSAAAPELVRVAGMHCESGDIVVDQEWLPGDVRAGDTLAVAATGAYCASLSSNYNATPRPPIVAVGEAPARAIVRRETIEDLLRRDTAWREPTVED